MIDGLNAGCSYSSSSAIADCTFSKVVAVAVVVVVVVVVIVVVVAK